MVYGDDGDECILTLSKTIQGLNFLICIMESLNSFYRYTPMAFTFCKPMINFTPGSTRVF